MKKNTFFTRVLSLVVALTFTLGFVSCSDDDDFVPDPNNPAVVKLPTKIFALEDDEDGPTISVLEYNGQNQLVKVTTFSANEDGTSTGSEMLNQKFSYDEKGRPAMSVITRPNSDWEEKNIYTYNESEGYVTINKSNWGYSYKIYIDKNGYRVVEKDATEGYVKLAYDNNYNLLTSVEIDLYEGVSYKDIDNYAYSDFFSPYLKLSLPAWFLEDESRLPFYEIYGGNFPKSGNSVSSKTKEGKEVITDKSFFNVNFLSTSDNYPTKIQVKSEYEKVGEEKEFSESNYTVEYKVVDKK